MRLQGVWEYAKCWAAKWTKGMCGQLFTHIAAAACERLLQAGWKIEQLIDKV